MTVYVVGSINADTRILVPLLPGPGETVIAETSATSPGGKGANQAIAAAAAGAPTVLVGAVGDDAGTRALVRSVAERGVDVTFLRSRTGSLTGQATVLVDRSAENSIVVLPGANATVTEEDVAIGLASIADGDVLVLQNEIPAHVGRFAARSARRAGATVIWNAAPAPRRQADIVTDVDLLVVNEHELASIGRLLALPDELSEAPAELPEPLLHAVARTLRTQVICTRGALGAVHSDGREAVAVAAPQVVAVDTTAAGDTVVGYLAAHRGLPVRAGMALAGAAGALTVTRPGASPSIPTLCEVEQWIPAVC
ncbi:PfkB family carbohydrate kinase [Streptomyces odontomachi]|uniref:PfkB family carbohydrate kinase n=1 Tax=Streptomyces odontomachi TaxID=2944940 RepID=UPI00210C40FD|nr:PfkB family carbohydrate kinase [Streptomyces sp. ODS25]